MPNALHFGRLFLQNCNIKHTLNGSLLLNEGDPLLYNLFLLIFEKRKEKSTRGSLVR